MQFLLDDPLLLHEAPASKRPIFRDYVSILEAAYAREQDEVQWLAGVLRAATPVVGKGLGTYAFSFRVFAGGVHIANPVHLNCPPGLHDALSVGGEIPLPNLRAAFGGPAMLLSQMGGIPDPLWHKLNLLGIVDQIATFGASLDLSGSAIVGLLPRKGAFPKDALRMLQLVSAHLAAAKRLRAKVGAGEQDQWTDVQAVLSPAGKVLHAEADARPKEARRTLSEAGQAMDRSRGRIRRTDPELALSCWRALIQGRWSLVERVDSDGKRLLLARKNASELPEPSALSLIEQQVAGYAAMGHSNKFIGYEVGIAPSTVTKHLKLAMRKLRFRSRAELIRVLFPAGPAAS